MPRAAATESKRSTAVPKLVAAVEEEEKAKGGLDAIGYVLGQAIAGWSHDRDVGRLRRALLAVLVTLDEETP